MGSALVYNNFLPIWLIFLYHMKTKWLVAARNLQSMKTLLTLEQWLSQYSSSKPVSSSQLRVTESVLQEWQNDFLMSWFSSCFPQAIWPAVTAADSETRTSAGRACCPKKLGDWFCREICPLNLRLPSSQRLPDDLQGLKFLLKLDLLHLTNEL